MLKFKKKKGSKLLVSIFSEDPACDFSVTLFRNLANFYSIFNVH